MNVDRCVNCGEIIPEGRMVCPRCEETAWDKISKRMKEIMNMDEHITHELKLNIEFCDAVYNGRKSFEIRRNDRGFQTGDHIKFIPFKSGAVVGPDGDASAMYPDHPIKTQEFIITYLLNGWGVQPGFVAMAIKKL